MKRSAPATGGGSSKKQATDSAKEVRRAARHQGSARRGMGRANRGEEGGTGCGQRARTRAEATPPRRG